jgi:hypothetical protein
MGKNKGIWHGKNPLTGETSVQCAPCPDMPLPKALQKYAPVVDLIHDNMSVTDACKRCGVGHMAYYQARTQHPQLAEMHDRAMALRVERVVDAAYALATGDAVEVRTSCDAEGAESTVTTKCAPNVQAIKYVLNNRRPDEWRDVVDVHHSGEEYTPLTILVRPVSVAADSGAAIAEKTPTGTVIDI